MSAYDWYKEFFDRKVLPGLLREMQGCTGQSGDDGAGFYGWLKGFERVLYDEITLHEERFTEIWMNRGGKPEFKEACRGWVRAHLTAKPKDLGALGGHGEQGRLV